MGSVRAFRNCYGIHGRFGRKGPVCSFGLRSPCLSALHSAARRMVSGMWFPVRVILSSSGWGRPGLVLKRVGPRKRAQAFPATSETVEAKSLRTPARNAPLLKARLHTAKHATGVLITGAAGLCSPGSLRGPKIPRLSTRRQRTGGGSWRTGRDSNPRYSCEHTRFPGEPIRPLWHLPCISRLLRREGAHPRNPPIAWQYFWKAPTGRLHSGIRTKIEGAPKALIPDGAKSKTRHGAETPTASPWPSQVRQAVPDPDGVGTLRTSPRFVISLMSNVLCR